MASTMTITTSPPRTPQRKIPPPKISTATSTSISLLKRQMDEAKADEAALTLQIENETTEGSFSRDVFTALLTLARNHTADLEASLLRLQTEEKERRESERKERERNDLIDRIGQLSPTKRPRAELEEELAALESIGSAVKKRREKSMRARLAAVAGAAEEDEGEEEKEKKEKEKEKAAVEEENEKKKEKKKKKFGGLKKWIGKIFGSKA